MGEFEIGTDVLVIGSGPAGYTAAIRCGRLGLDTTIAGTQLGGVCLHMGCIPVKSLMHALDLTLEAREACVFGVEEQATVDLKKAQAWKDKVIGRLAGGIASMLKEAGVQMLEGICAFESPDAVVVKTRRGHQRVSFKRAVIATGSHFRLPEGVRMDGERVTSPYGITMMDKVPAHAVVLGGGIGGATTASLLAKMGALVTLAYRGKTLTSTVDDDVLQPSMQWLRDHNVTLLPGAAWQVSPTGENVKITSAGKDYNFTPDKLIFATPQEANTPGLGLKNTKVTLNDKGFIVADENFRTTDPAIYAIGDVLGGARNASVAFREGLSVAGILAGKPGLPDYQAVPMTIYMEPPVAVAGLTGRAAAKQGLDVIVGQAPYGIDGAAILSDDTDGLVKVIADRASHRILGVQIAGRNAPDILAEGMLAIETGARLEDMALTLHPHPELCEVLYEACARAAGISATSRPNDQT